MCSMSTAGGGVRVTLVEVLERTFGHDGALVSAPRRSISSETDELQATAAVERLQSVIENPGPFSDVSKCPEYIFIGSIPQVDSRYSQQGFLVFKI